MTAFDIIVLFLIGGAAVFGFMRGFVQESLSLASWVLIIVAIRVLHAPVAEQLAEPVGTEAGAGALAFLSILVVAYALGKWISRSFGKKSRSSMLGPIDRVLGFGFGAIKGLITATMLFLFIVMIYETVFTSNNARPKWLTESRTYPLINASGEAMSSFVAERRKQQEAEAQAQADESERPGI